MIDLYYWGTPNGHKLTLCLEELALPYRIIPVDIGNGDQYKPEYLVISPNNKMPALIDHDPADGGPPLAMFESGAMMWYLAERAGMLLPADPRKRMEVMQWLFWQVGGLGPMAGQAGHFRAHAPEPMPYAIDRYTRETARLYGVLNKRLEHREYIVDEYSIADIACYPWIVSHEGHGQDLNAFPHLKRWFESIAARPASVRTYRDAKDAYARSAQPLSDEERRHLFGTRT